MKQLYRRSHYMTAWYKYVDFRWVYVLYQLHWAALWKYELLVSYDVVERYRIPDKRFRIHYCIQLGHIAMVGSISQFCLCPRHNLKPGEDQICFALKPKNDISRRLRGFSDNLDSLYPRRWVYSPRM